MKKETPFSEIFSATVGLSVIPVLFYFAAYLYVREYCAQYGIPTDFVSININTVLSVSVKVVPTALFIMSFIFIFGRMMGRNFSTNVALIVGLNVIFIACFFIVCQLYLEWIDRLKILVPVFLFMNYYAWGFKFIRIFATGIVKVKSGENAPELLLDSISNRFQFWQMGIISVLILSICLAPVIARLETINSDKIMFVAQKPNLVVVIKSEDFFVCKVIDLKKKVLTDSLVLIKIDDKSPLTLVAKEVKDFRFQAH